MLCFLSLPSWGWMKTTDDNVEVGFSLKLFGGPAGEKPISVAQGVDGFPFEVLITSAKGAPLKCAKGHDIKKASTFEWSLMKGEEIKCQSAEDRKLQIVYRIKKAIVQNVFAKQLTQLLDELEAGAARSEASEAILRDVVSKYLNTAQLKASQASVMVLSPAQKTNVPMVTILLADPMTFSGSTIQASGNPDTARSKNLYPQLNRFALTCGFANPQSGVISKPIVPPDHQKEGIWILNSSGQPFGCIVNNSPDGFDAIDPYVEDPFFTLHYMMIPKDQFKANLEQMRFEITSSIDRNRAEKLKSVALSLLEKNKKRVQDEMERRRIAVLEDAGYSDRLTVTLHPIRYLYHLTGKPHYTSGSGKDAGELQMNTIFDVQGQKVEFEFKWPDGSSHSLTEDRAWTGVTQPVLAKGYDTRLAHFKYAYQVCSSDVTLLGRFLTGAEATPYRYTKDTFLAGIIPNHPCPSTKSVGGEDRELRYQRYEGSCFMETPYQKNGQTLIRYRPSRIDLVYADDQKHAMVKVPLDLDKIKESQNLFSGLDVVTTLPYDTARAGTYRLNCDGHPGGFPAGAFTADQLQAQEGVPGFPQLVESATAPRASERPQSGVLDLRIHQHRQAVR